MNSNNTKFLIKSLNELNERVIKCQQLLYIMSLNSPSLMAYTNDRSKLNTIRMLINEVIKNNE